MEPDHTLRMGWFVWLVWLVLFSEPEKPDQPYKPDKPERPIRGMAKGLVCSSHMFIVVACEGKGSIPSTCWPPALAECLA